MAERVPIMDQIAGSRGLVGIIMSAIPACQHGFIIKLFSFLTLTDLSPLSCEADTFPYIPLLVIYSLEIISKISGWMVWNEKSNGLHTLKGQYITSFDKNKQTQHVWLY